MASFDKKNLQESPRVSLRHFLKIFEKDSFGEKAINAIKQECCEMRKETNHGERIRDYKIDDSISVSAASRYSKN